MVLNPLPSVHADNEWSPLRAVIVGRAGRACFPKAPMEMIRATMPEQYFEEFERGSPFPEDLISKAEAELDHLATLLEAQGIMVYRPTPDVDWQAVQGYTGAMARDGLMSVGSTLIEACFAWSCRSREIELGFSDILDKLDRDQRVTVVRRPKSSFADTLLDGEPSKDNGPWVINNSRPAFDTADFMRFGKTILGQRSHVTNTAGIEYVRDALPPGYELEVLEVDDPHAMHIDATILPLRDGLLVYHPQKITEAELRRHRVLESWELHPYPFIPEERDDPPLYMTSPWLCLNALVLDGRRMLVEASDHRTMAWLQSLGMECIPCPFQHVNSIGGSFHCATVDLVRR
ncbi:hypothetical protein BX600DRAFT_431716 [Xylariales sp. PMI_506]|nr:hypothetical protein BX600DRAFT_431716 [Xylariales sp. PMI_506]